MVEEKREEKRRERRKRRRKNVYLCVQYFRPLRSQVELDPSEGTLQRDPPDKQDRQHQVGEGRCEIHHLQQKDKGTKKQQHWCHG